MKTAPDCLIAGCEILWDCFPDGNRLGGATCNVGYHLNQLGMKPGLIANTSGTAILNGSRAATTCRPGA
jgi:hypothetical protein